ncbi:alpha-amylase family glycosyl hydrolase [Oceanobacter mangrovi]|uniref:alpha-amylase family glycosyl hydrolase n=1 Tax=Oceanobacter mangrovi TaxID=2862510 RepID=UPI001C8EED27|nr:alpha-amylase family glycosyl hydrolase [Oceanobacter mangrovi]
MSWWKYGVVYQVYPRSFQDGNGDGCGDLRGLINRLDYLNDGTENSLGVDAIWLSPINPSPMHDFGYDVSDYRDIDPVFGTLADFDELVQQAHQRSIRIILDLVLNHTSHQHPWFLESCQPGSAKADWYIWHEGKQRPNNWQSCFGGSGWSWHEQRQAWYYHSFLPQQPDLNWRHPEVVEAIRELLDFWLERGVDGFRLDVVNYYFKDQQLRNNPIDWLRIARPYDRQHHHFDRDQPEMHQALQAMRQWIDAHPDRMMVGEVFIAETDSAALPASYYGQNDQLHLAFNLEFLRTPFSAWAFREAIQRWEELLGPNNWPCYTLSNHDIKRHISRYDKTGFTHDRGRLLALLLLSLRGTPFLYYGEEIGMPEQRVPRQHLQDPVGLRYWPLHPGRDGCRRPMMWSPDPADFSTAASSWLPNQPQPGISVQEQQYNPSSLLSWYRQLIWLRRRNATLQRGQLKLLDSGYEVLVFMRHGKNLPGLLVVLNFSHYPMVMDLHQGAIAKVLANSHERLEFEEGDLLLQPLQGLILKPRQDFPMPSALACQRSRGAF